MSDPKSNYGRPVDDPAADDDVVGRAHDSLAEAEAAQRDAVAEPRDDGAGEPAAQPLGRDDVPDRVETVPPVQPVTAPTDRDEIADSRDQPETPWYDRPEASDAAAPAAASVYTDTSAPAADPATPVVDVDDDDDDRRYAAYEASAADDTEARPAADTKADPADDPDRYDTVAAAPVVAAPLPPSEQAAPQPIFVQAPEAPRPRGNRGAAGAIGLLAAVCFAVLYLAAWLAFSAINGAIAADTVVQTLVGALSTWSFWVPVIVFFIAFWLLGAIINRGRWAAWVVLGLLVGLASYGGHILGALFQAPFWTLTVRDGGALVEGELLAPLAIAAFVIGRELTIWFGAWVAARGKRVTELNVEARREYERTLEAGPQLARL